MYEIKRHNTLINGFDATYIESQGVFSGETHMGPVYKNYSEKPSFWKVLKDQGLVQDSPTLVRIGDWLDKNRYDFDVYDTKYDSDNKKGYLFIVPVSDRDQIDKLVRYIGGRNKLRLRRIYSTPGYEFILPAA